MPGGAGRFCGRRGEGQLGCSSIGHAGGRRTHANEEQAGSLKDELDADEHPEKRLRGVRELEVSSRARQQLRERREGTHHFR